VIYIGEILLAIINISMAAHHAALIRMGRPIKHGLWGGLYLVVAALFAWLTNSVWLFVIALPLRKVLFDISLNIFRKKPLWYQSAATGSIIDKLHSNLNPRVYTAVYVIFIIVANIFLL
jgi:hypothetical protein